MALSWKHRTGNIFLDTRLLVARELTAVPLPFSFLRTELKSPKQMEYRCAIGCYKQIFISSRLITENPIWI